MEGQARPWLTPITSLIAGIETVYQDLSLVPNMTVAENVALSEQLVRSGGALGRRLDRGLMHSTAQRALKAVGLPPTDEFLDTVVSSLPLAVRQLVVSAAAVLAAPTTEAAGLAALQAVQFVATLFGSLISEAGVPVDFEETVTPSWLRDVPKASRTSGSN